MTSPSHLQSAGAITHGCWTAPHLSPALPGCCLCPCDIKVGVFVWTSRTDSALRLGEERVKKGAGFSPGLVSVWSHVLGLPLPGASVHQTGQTLSKREDEPGSRCPVPATSKNPFCFPAPLVTPHLITLGVMVVSANTNALGLQRARVGGWVGKVGSRH